MLSINYIGYKLPVHVNQISIRWQKYVCVDFYNFQNTIRDATVQYPHAIYSVRPLGNIGG